MSCNRDSGNNQWQNGGDDTQDAAESWGNVGTKSGNGLQGWLLFTTGEDSLALPTADTIGAGAEFDAGSSEAGGGEGKDGDDFGEMHFDGLVRYGEVKVEVNVYV